jgi:hypothetical protein
LKREERKLMELESVEADTEVSSGNALLFMPPPCDLACASSTSVAQQRLGFHGTIHLLRPFLWSRAVVVGVSMVGFCSHLSLLILFKDCMSALLMV